MQGSLLSPSTPTKLFEARQGPQVCDVDRHAWRFNARQLGALLQLTALTTAERVEMACFVPSALLVTIDSCLATNKFSAAEFLGIGVTVIAYNAVLFELKQS